VLDSTPGATVAVATTIAVSTVAGIAATGATSSASAIAASSAGSALPSVMSLQRYAMYARIGIAPQPCEDDGTLTIARLVRGSLSVFRRDSQACSAYTANFTNATQQDLYEDAIKHTLFTALEDLLISALMIMGVFALLHFALLFLWFSRCNRKYYAYHVQNAQKMKSTSTARQQEKDAPISLSDVDPKVLPAPSRLPAAQTNARAIPSPSPSPPESVTSKDVAGPAVAPPLHRGGSSPSRYSKLPKTEQQVSAGSATGTPRSGGKKHPGFRRLPPALVPPNLEVAIFLVYCPGFVEASMAIWGAFIGGIYFSEDDAGHLVLAAIVLAVVLLFFVCQGAALFHFWRNHAKELWVPAERPAAVAEVDDAALRVIAPVVGPRAREAGAFEATIEGISEPARTEMILAHSLRCGFCAKRDRKAIREDSLLSSQRLRTWLSDSSGSSRNGILYLYVQSVVQVLVSLVVAIFEHDLIPGRTTRISTQLSLLIFLLFVVSLWSVWGFANDRIEGIVAAVAYALECASMCLLLASHNAGEDDGVSDAANCVLLAAVVAPLALQLYDATINPAYKFARTREGTAAEIAWALLIAFVLLPCQLASSALGMCEDPDDILAIAAEVEGSVQETIVDAGDVPTMFDDMGPEEVQA